MIAERAQVDYRGAYRNRTYLFPDDRKGLGYGQISPTGFNASRQSQSSYPYLDPDENEEYEYDLAFTEDELDRFVKKINMGYTVVDALAGNSTDPFYYVAGNTTGLGGVSESTLHGAKNSLVPFPRLYQKKQAVSGGHTQQQAYDQRPYRRTGTLRGYFHSPPYPIDLPEDEIDLDTLLDFLNDEGLAVIRAQDTQRRIRRANNRGE